MSDHAVHAVYLEVIGSRFVEPEDVGLTRTEPEDENDAAQCEAAALADQQAVRAKIEAYGSADALLAALGGFEAVHVNGDPLYAAQE